MTTGALPRTPEFIGQDEGGRGPLFAFPPRPFLHLAPKPV
jgi:hypothetical protein